MTKNTDSAGRAQQISYGSGMVSSVIDPMGTHTTTYSYSNANCQLWNNSSGGVATSASSSNVLSTSAKSCSTGNQTTTVSYPDAEIDVNSYSNSQLIATSFGASATASSADTESWSFFYVQASAAGQDDAVTQTVVGPTDAGVAPSSQPAILVVDVAGDLTSFTDPNGNTTTAAYNDLGGNNRHELCWSASPGTSLASTPSCPATSTGVPGFSSYVYDSVGNLVASVDQAGSITRNAYSATTGLRCWTTPPSVSTASTLCSSVPTGATRYTYSNRGDLKSTTVGYGTTAPSVSTSAYNDDGQVTCTLPPNGQAGAACGSGSNPYATTYAYFANGSIQTLTPPSPAGASSYTYDGAGNVLTIKQVTTPARMTTNKYDANGRLCWTYTASTTSSNACSSPPTGASLVENSYLADTTAPTQETDASGKVTNFTYSDARFPTQATKSVTSSGSNPSTLYSSFDPYGNTCVSGPAATTVASCSSVAGDTSSQYAAGDSAYPVQTSTTNADGGVTTSFFDDQGQLIATTGPSGNPTTCDPTTSSVPCADTVANQYDAAGRLTCSLEPNLANNTCASPGSGAGVIRYSYTSTGQRASMVDATGTTSYSYDSFDRLIKVVDGLGATITYGYDLNSNLTCLTYPSASIGSWCPSNGGTGTGPGTVSYSYGTNGQVSAVGDWAGNSFSLSYDVNGDLTGVSANAGAVGIANAYTPTSLLSGIAVTASSGTSNLVSFSISRNQGGLGTIASVTPTLGTTPMATDSFTYTPSSQVASGPIGAPSGSTSYAYSNSGNIVQGANQFGTATYSQANGNGHLCWTSPSSSTNGCSLAPSGSTTYSYNADGQRTGANPSTGNPSTYAWDSARGTLVCVNTNGTTCTGPGATSTSYSYNGDNLRMSATSGTGSSTFAWNSAESIPQLLSDATSSYVYLPGTNVPLEQISGSGSTITSDLLITGANSEVRGLVQLQGTPSLQSKLVNYTDYDSYGNPITASGGAAEPGGVGNPQTSINSNFVGTTPFGFGGGYTDATGLIYLIARYYDPGSAQFVSVDPLVEETNQAYEYASGNPVNLIDPKGLHVHGRCLGVSAVGIVGVTLTYCSIWDTYGGHMVQRTFGGAAGFGFGVGFGWLNSNAAHVRDLLGSGVCAELAIYVPQGQLCFSSTPGVWTLLWGFSGGPSKVAGDFSATYTSDTTAAERFVLHWSFNFQ
jgi:RHS repeat-associated protein